MKTIKMKDHRAEVNRKIRNLDALPRGTGARFLVCLDDTWHDTLIAMAWKRKRPATLPEGQVLIEL